MQSSSSLTISWSKPELATEQWEFFKHPAKQDFYHRNNLSWEQLCNAFEEGCLTPYPRSAQLDKQTVELSYSSYDDYSHYLAKAKRGYRSNYSAMEEALQRQGELALPAAIILQSNSSSLLFSGYRRLCLAWNYGMTPYVWLVKLSKRTVC